MHLVGSYYTDVRYVSSSGLSAAMNVEVRSHYSSGCVVRSCGCQDWLFMRHSCTATEWYAVTTAKITAFWDVMQILNLLS